jgi:hypothetical protein
LFFVQNIHKVIGNPELNGGYNKEQYRNSKNRTKENLLLFIEYIITTY